MDKILIIEDDTDINSIIYEALKKAGYECSQAFSGTEGLLYLEKEDFSLIILDLMLPGLKGEALLPEIKKRGQTPVIVVSAKDELDSKVELLTAGAEDYITKPFEIRELVARAGVQIRRFRAEKSFPGAALSYKGLTLDTGAFTVSANGKSIDLTRQEFKILELFLTNPQRVYSKQEIYDYAWDDIYIGEDKTINVHISNIRKKLKEACGEEYIETVWGIGFRLKKQL